ncbi:MAG: N-acetyltransferase [Clostridia bacterium]|nr:N-acetyltransferase [Clostridia bacterium]
MQIRNAEIGDMEAVVRVYRAAKDYMDRTGNETQWERGYPAEAMIREDIASRRLYVVEEDRCIHAVFYFGLEEDETYRRIYDGAWKNDEPYGVIHRVGSDGAVRGVIRAVVDFCLQTVKNLRIDTHENNKTMQHVLQKCGFERCGIIYLQNGDARIAYHLVV